MLIIWGRKTSRKHSGYTCRWCTVRRRFAVFKVYEFRSVAHLYYVPLGRSRCLNLELVCPDTSFGAIVAADAPLPIWKTRPSLDEIESVIDDSARSAAAAVQKRDALLASPSTLPSERIAAILERLKSAETGLTLPNPLENTAIRCVIGASVLITTGVWFLFEGWMVGIVPLVCASVLLLLTLRIVMRESRHARFKRMKDSLLESVLTTNADLDEIAEALDRARLYQWAIHGWLRKELGRAGVFP